MTVMIRHDAQTYGTRQLYVESSRLEGGGVMRILVWRDRFPVGLVERQPFYAVVAPLFASFEVPHTLSHLA